MHVFLCKVTNVFSAASVMTKHQVQMASRSNSTTSFGAVLVSMSLTASTTPFMKAVCQSLKSSASFRRYLRKI